eukprot:324286-Pleurochrysis_carterae.AAC.1
MRRGRPASRARADERGPGTISCTRACGVGGGESEDTADALGRSSRGAVFNAGLHGTVPKRENACRTSVKKPRGSNNVHSTDSTASWTLASKQSR